MPRFLQIPAICALFFALSACGTKGALYLPKNPPPAQAPGAGAVAPPASAPVPAPAGAQP